MGREFPCLGQGAWEGLNQQRNIVALHFGNELSSSCSVGDCGEEKREPHRSGLWILCSMNDIVRWRQRRVGRHVGQLRLRVEKGVDIHAYKTLTHTG